MRGRGRERERCTELEEGLRRGEVHTITSPIERSHGRCRSECVQHVHVFTVGRDRKRSGTRQIRHSYSTPIVCVLYVTLNDSIEERKDAGRGVPAKRVQSAHS